MKKELYSKISVYCEKNGISDLLENCSGVIVGFSGGADSVFLLSYLNDVLSPDKGLMAVHLNHSLRGTESDRDERFCLDFCRAKGIDFISEKADVYAVSKTKKMGIEECARELRYKLFGECRRRLAKKFSVSVEKILIATAHNADDNVETVLFNVVRGSSALGLCGIPPVRDGKYVRPILGLTALEIREYLAENGVKFVFDSTNAEDDYTRNKIRHNVVPHLQELNPSVQKSFTRLSETMRRDEAYFEAEVSKILGENREKGTASLASLKDVHSAVLTRAIATLYGEICPRGNLSFVHISAVEEMIRSGKSGELHLPEKIVVTVGEKIVFSKGSLKKSGKTPSFCRFIENGLNVFEDLGFVLSVDGISSSPCSEEFRCIGFEGAEMGIIYNSLIYISLNNDKIKGTVQVRNRRESDTYLLGGHHKKVKKLFCDKKIPLEMRDRLPLVCDEDGILWIPGFPPRDGCVFKGEGKEIKIGYYLLDKEK